MTANGNQFFETFKEYQGREFHMAGESYGVSSGDFDIGKESSTDIRQGRYLPLFASAVVDGNKDLVALKKQPINLQSVMIGNGITDFCEWKSRSVVL